MNKEIEKITQRIEKAEAQLRKAQQQKKILEHQAKELTRKERTHRLCTRGAMLESYFPQPEAVTDEQVEMFFKLLFHQSDTHELMQRIFSNTQKKETE